MFFLWEFSPNGWLRKQFGLPEHTSHSGSERNNAVHFCLWHVDRRDGCFYCVWYSPADTSVSTPTPQLPPPCGQSGPRTVHSSSCEVLTLPKLNSPSHGLSHATSFKNMHSSRGGGRRCVVTNVQVVTWFCLEHTTHALSTPRWRVDDVFVGIERRFERRRCTRGMGSNRQVCAERELQLVPESLLLTDETGRSTLGVVMLAIGTPIGSVVAHHGREVTRQGGVHVFAV